ncbi:MAG: FUN14 domain-containing protein [bacterium]
MDVSALVERLGPDLGFGGVAGAVVGYTAKKVTKLIALALGLVFILIQLLVYFDVLLVNWTVVQNGAHHVWSDGHGVTLADRAWTILSANLPFGAAFAAGFALGFKIG